ncbi:hypothetical protein TNCT_404371 [Trichonephila clavata]|uniref:Uncharacterized protein n=1 Tax=Trichonephila clavata TaxID=2740835 RepID=A0A8X6HBI5_TRICU|nr:hypothetical protein TNCT_404371 [Trichonephila clavata]
MEACVARQSPKIFMDSFKPLFCCGWMHFPQRRYPAVQDRRSIDRFEAACSSKRHGVLTAAGKRNPRCGGEGETILFSVSLKLYGCHEVSRTACRMEACVARQSP